MFVAAGMGADRFCEAVTRLGGEAAPLDGELPPGLRLIHLEAPSVLADSDPGRLREVVDAARAAGAIVSLDLGLPEWVRSVGGSRATYRLAYLRPDLLFAREEAAAELGAPLEGIASVPVLIRPDGCEVYGRRLAAVPGRPLDPDVLAAAFCVAFAEGVAPVEAAARALLAGRMLDLGAGGELTGR